MNDYILKRIKDFGKFFCWAWIDRAYYYLGGVVQPHDYLIEGADGQAVCNEDEYRADFVNMWENNLDDKTRLEIFKDVSGCETDQDVIDFFPPNKAQKV